MIGASRQPSFDSPHGWWHHDMWYLGGCNSSSMLIATTASVSQSLSTWAYLTDGLILWHAWETNFELYEFHKTSRKKRFRFSHLAERLAAHRCRKPTCDGPGESSWQTYGSVSMLCAQTDARNVEKCQDSWALAPHSPPHLLILVSFSSLSMSFWWEQIVKRMITWLSLVPRHLPRWLGLTKMQPSLIFYDLLPWKVIHTLFWPKNKSYLPKLQLSTYRSDKENMRIIIELGAMLGPKNLLRDQEIHFFHKRG